ncbi:hypothetical protein [Demequina muriae]|uniref:Uncharacterized protein n=1 Tax=Demequina muriae TaxID=3051664 RepID=A0ABT8GJX9_9MICO|nr:hypothetical protein [Demequina sp. EGI L300058]MDN4481732.1 hypothetical protein [Demequina sp. EGI L300058]
MSDQKSTDTRHYRFEQIRARELARGASDDEATRIATETVDKVIAAEGESK